MLPVLTKAGPIRSMRSMCWDPPETGVVDGLVHTDVVGNIFFMYFITVLAGRFSAFFQEQLPSIAVSGFLPLTEVSLDIPPAVVTF